MMYEEYNYKKQIMKKIMFKDMILKRFFDISVSFFGLLFFLPLFLVISFLIKIKMPGAILFCQNRIGKNGKLFRLVKFRTMREFSAGSSISIIGDSRITPLGVILRKYKIDELPSLWNVFKGEMSFVGPRPDVPGYADKLKGSDRLILKLKPGITGPASLKYANEEELLARVKKPHKYNDEVIFPDKVRINLAYYYNRTFWGDVKIILHTFLRINYK